MPKGKPRKKPTKQIQVSTKIQHVLDLLASGFLSPDEARRLIELMYSAKDPSELLKDIL